MVTILKSFNMDWEEKKTVKKGNIGEDIVNKYLESKGLIVYTPITSGPHGFDRLVSKGKEKLIIVEVKTKAKRNNYPDTGINYSHYLGYKEISKKYNLPVWLFFVDEMIGSIYGGNLNELDKPNCFKHKGKSLSYPMVYDGKGTKTIYFHQPSMCEISTLTKKQIEQIKKHSTRKHNYKNPE